MVNEINEGEKKLKLVYIKENTDYDEKDHVNLTEKANIQVEKKNTVLKNSLVENTQKNNIDAFRAGLNKPRHQKIIRIQNIAKAVQMANHRENQVTEKFLQDIEILVTRFKTELDKMRELFGNILKKLPQLQLDVAVTTS